jgi:hypothetical protein
MINHRLHKLDESHGVWQLSVSLEGGFVCPTGVYPEQPGIPDRPIGTMRQATWFGKRLAAFLEERRSDCDFLAFAGMEACEDE